MRDQCGTVSDFNPLSQFDVRTGAREFNEHVTHVASRINCKRCRVRDARITTLWTKKAARVLSFCAQRDCTPNQSQILEVCPIKDGRFDAG